MWFLLSENKPILLRMMSQPLSVECGVTARALSRPDPLTVGVQGEPRQPCLQLPLCRQPHSSFHGQRQTLCQLPPPHCLLLVWAPSPAGAAGLHPCPCHFHIPPSSLSGPQWSLLSCPSHPSTPQLPHYSHPPQLQTGACPSPAPILHSTTCIPTARLTLRAPMIQS